MPKAIHIYRKKVRKNEEGKAENKKSNGLHATMEKLDTADRIAKALFALH